MLERIEQAEQFFRCIGAIVRQGGNQAFYSPVRDHIQMPPKNSLPNSGRHPLARILDWALNHVKIMLNIFSPGCESLAW